MNVRYRVELSQAERDELAALLSGKHSVRKLKRAQILLAADAGESDAAVAASLRVGGRPYSGPSAVLCSATWLRRSARSRALERPASSRARGSPAGRHGCSSPPAGRARWTLELLAGGDRLTPNASATESSSIFSPGANSNRERLTSRSSKSCLLMFKRAQCFPRMIAEVNSDCIWAEQNFRPIAGNSDFDSLVDAFGGGRMHSWPAFLCIATSRHALS